MAVELVDYGEERNLRGNGLDPSDGKATVVTEARARNLKPKFWNLALVTLQPQEHEARIGGGEATC